jgi:hypothetical protein
MVSDQDKTKVYICSCITTLALGVRGFRSAEPQTSTMLLCSLKRKPLALFEGAYKRETQRSNSTVSLSILIHGRNITLSANAQISTLKLKPYSRKILAKFTDDTCK